MPRKETFEAIARYYRYPQYSWARELRLLLATLPTASTNIVVDAPCGDGIISFWLQRWLPATRFELYDLSERCIRAAAANLPAKVKIVRADIHELPAEPGADVWLLINSLYLLPNAGVLLNRMRKRMAHILGIFPYLEHRNYRCYFRRFPTLTNPSAMTDEETVRLFRRCGYKLLYRRSLTFIPFHCLAFPGFDWFSHRLFNLLDACFNRITSPCYWLALFERNSSG
ncbi:MAG: class I SAM-dependent methyltransferase [Kiritimatiellia bacterium]